MAMALQAGVFAGDVEPEREDVVLKVNGGES